MSKFLQQLLDAKEPLFTSGLHRLETASGHAAVDIRLIADITHKAHEVMRTLRLDTADTTGKELYMALNAYIKRDQSGRLLYDSDYVLITIGDQTISMNLIDVIENHHHELPFEKRHMSHARRSLRGEIVDRYIDHARTDEVAVRGIAEDTGLILVSDLGHIDYKKTLLDTETESKRSK